MLTQRQLELARTARLRGWIIYFLYKARPRPLDLISLRTLLDQKNFPLSRRLLSVEMDYLRSLRLFRVFPSGADTELSEIDQTKLIQQYADFESDIEMGVVLCARITAAGTNFQDGINDMEGITRVE